MSDKNNKEEKKTTFTLTQVDIARIKSNLLQIERWRGDAYCNDDDIGRAMQELKTMMSCLVYGNYNEECPECGEQIDSNLTESVCPNCKEEVLACSMCTMVYDGGCGGCVAGNHYDVDIDLL